MIELWILFISLGVLLVLTVLLLILYPKLHKNKFKKNFVSIYGKKVYRYALHNDLYLINQLELRGNDDQRLKVDHLLFGTKYIYLIKDYYLPGVIEAKEKDHSFIYKSSEKNSKKVYIDNPLIENKRLLKKVALNVGLNESLFISIVLLNDDAELDNFVSTSKDNFIVHLSSFNRLINQLESRKVAPLNDNQLRYTVKDVNKLNVRNKKN